ncbi:MULTISPECIES: hypothetical protein [Streptomyces]|uniref:hypothetical protein n=1 Tax=Streptomyces TaxID=1883 RepID=UPI001488F436|nr:MULTISPECIES: hypothetical protein [Streptomyces]
MAPVARFRNVVLDCPDPRALARFYAEIVGGIPDDTRKDFRVYADPAGHPFCLCRIEHD